MDTTVIKGGRFTAALASADLTRGLRPSSRTPRNKDFLVECVGAVGRDGVLSALDEMTEIDTSIITDGFPFPQIFVFTNVVIVCGLSKVYEWNGTALHLELTLTQAQIGGMWSAVDFYDYVYMSNGTVAVVRDAGSDTYAVSADLPHATCMCNYNGQVLIGAPDVSGLGANELIIPDPATTWLVISGDMETTV